MLKISLGAELQKILDRDGLGHYVTGDLDKVLWAVARKNISALDEERQYDLMVDTFMKVFVERKTHLKFDPERTKEIESYISLIFSGQMLTYRRDEMRAYKKAQNVDVQDEDGNENFEYHMENRNNPINMKLGNLMTRIDELLYEKAYLEMRCGMIESETVKPFKNKRMMKMAERKLDRVKEELKRLDYEYEEKSYGGEYYRWDMQQDTNMDDEVAFEDLKEHILEIAKKNYKDDFKNIKKMLMLLDSGYNMDEVSKYLQVRSGVVSKWLGKIKDIVLEIASEDSAFKDLYDRYTNCGKDLRSSFGRSAKCDDLEKSVLICFGYDLRNAWND